MNLLQALFILMLFEAVVVLLAALVWRDRLAMLSLRLFGLGGAEPSDDEYASRLADAFRRVKWLKEKSAIESGGEQAGSFEEALECLRRAGASFRSRPAASVHFGQPLLRGCELLARSLEMQMTQVDAGKQGAASALAAATLAVQESPAPESPLFDDDSAIEDLDAEADAGDGPAENPA